MASTNVATATVSAFKGREDTDLWKYVVQAYLQSEEFRNVLNGSSTKRDENKTKKEESKTGGKTVVLVKHINDTHTWNATAARQTWDCLVNVFEDCVLKEVFTTKFNCLNQTVSCVHKLKVTGSDITPELVVVSNANYRKPITRVKCSGYSASYCKKGCNDDKNEVGRGDVSLVCLSATHSLDSNEWIIDSGASRHMTNRSDWLINDKPVNDYVTIANDSKLTGKGVGSIELTLKNENGTDNLKIDDVLHVPDLFTNLLSVSRLVKTGLTVTFNESGCKIISKQGKVMANGSLFGDIFKLDQWEPTAETTSSSVLTSTQDEMELWHQRYAHLGHDSLCKLNNINIVDGMKFKNNLRKMCEICVKGKKSRFLFGPGNSRYSRTSQVLELIHSDVCGKLPECIGGFRYFITFTDDFSRKVFVYFIRYKAESLEKFKLFRSFVENQTKKKIQKFRSDNGSENFGKGFDHYLTSIGIMYQSSTQKRIPKQNGIAEQMNRTLVEKGRCLLFGGHLNLNFWAEAISTAVYLVNRSLSCGFIEKTPQEIWTLKKPNVSHLRVFGCKAIMNISNGNRKKSDPKSKVCVMVGYSEESKAYRLMDPETEVYVYNSRDVVFMEDERCISYEVNDVKLLNDNFVFVIDKEIESENEYNDRDTKDGDSVYASPSQLVSQDLRKATKIPKRANRCTTCIAKSDIPSTFEGPSSRTDRSKWESAIHDESNSLEEY